jgi:CPA1 family monovalent cation:H+ antiporter
MHNPFNAIALYLLVATVASALLVNRGWNNILPVILLGAVISLLPFSLTIPPDPGMVISFFLVPLVYGGALQSSLHDLRRVGSQVIKLTIIPVVASTLAVGAVITSVSDISWPLALALGAILSPTDSVALNAAGVTERLPSRLITLLEGESLLNDVSGLTAYHLAILAALHGQISAAEGMEIFGKALLAGLAVGMVTGWLASLLIRQFADKKTAVNAVVMVLPFASYAIADSLEGSPILAIVTVAIYVGYTEYQSPEFRGRLANSALWEHLIFVLQAVTFLLIGMELPDIMVSLPHEDTVLVLTLIPLVVVALLTARLLSVLLIRLTRMTHRSSQAFLNWKESAILVWMGARGPVSGLAAFSIPLTMLDGSALPHRDILLATAFGVILVTLLLSLTLKPLIQKLGIEASSEKRRFEIEIWQQLLQSTGQHLHTWYAEASHQPNQDPKSQAMLQRMMREYAYREYLLDRLSQEAGHAASAQNVTEHIFENGDFNFYDILMSDVLIRLTKTERDTLLELRKQGRYPDHIIRHVMHKTDLRLLYLESLLRSESS